MSTLLHTLLGYITGPLLGVILGPFVYLAGQLGQKLYSRYDQLPPWGKQLAALCIGFVLVQLAHLIPGFVTPAACSSVAGFGFTPDCAAALTSKDTLTAIISALVAMAAHDGQAKAATAPVQGISTQYKKT